MLTITNVIDHLRELQHSARNILPNIDPESDEYHFILGEVRAYSRVLELIEQQQSHEDESQTTRPDAVVSVG